MNEEATPEELSVEEFMELSEEKPSQSKVSDQDLLDYLNTAKRTNACATHFDISYSAMLARLKKLASNGKVEKRYKERAVFWINAAIL